MKKTLTFVSLLAIMLLCACGQKDGTPRAKHVILIGCDAMGAYAIQRAETPTFNYMIENGAFAINTRCVRITGSCPNWFSMINGANIEMHSVPDNGWTQELFKNKIQPIRRNRLGQFPSIFDCLKEQRPDAKLYGYVDWCGQFEMYDTCRFDKLACVTSQNHWWYYNLMELAFEDYLRDQPEFMYISLDYPDYTGHRYGHESQAHFDGIHDIDARLGKFIRTLEERDMLKDVVIIVTADHGGFFYDHGGDTMEEFCIPIILFGGNVTKGKFIQTGHMIYDNAVTAAGLLGIKLPEECYGRFLHEAFEPVKPGEASYVAMPLVHPYRGEVPADGKVRITADTDGAEIYYTLDGSAPTRQSIHYDGPFALPADCTINAIAYKGADSSWVATNHLYLAAPKGQGGVSYKLYHKCAKDGKVDFAHLGTPDETGLVSAFSIRELPLQPEERDYAVVFEGDLDVPADGTYHMPIVATDGTNVYLDGKLITPVESEFIQGGNPRQLKAGKHHLKVEYVGCGNYVNLLFYFDTYTGLKEDVPEIIMIRNNEKK